MWGAEPKRIAAAFAATAAALVTMVARADDLPGAYGGHGVAFTYPSTWLHQPGDFAYESGSSLWHEFFGPQQAPPTTTPPPVDPTQPAPAPTPAPTPAPLYDLVAVVAYRTNVTITKKTLPRYKFALQLMVMRLAAQTGGQVLSGPTRITLGRSKLPGYTFTVSTNLPDAPSTVSRLVLVFNKKTEYFLNCQHVKDGPLAAEIDSGCAQVMQSFRLTK